MIPTMNIVAWGTVVPWAEPRQVEQDLIISRAIVELFADSFLRSELRFRGGTALNKLHFPAPLRYSDDIDLVRTTPGPIKPILAAMRARLEPWLGKAGFEQSPTAPKLRFKVPTEVGSAEIRLKVEINTREIESYDPPLSLPFAVSNPWFTGKAEVATFSREEILATKLRALLQRDKGRDLFDLAHALDVFPKLRTERVVQCLASYLKRSNLAISRAEAEKRMFAKLRSPTFLTDLRPLLPPAEAQRLNMASTKEAFQKVLSHFILLMPGKPWARTEEMKTRLGMDE